MANLTGLISDLYEAVDQVSRELTGFIPSVTWDTGADRAALNQTVRVPITPAAAASDVTPGTVPPDDGDQTIGNTPIVITKSRMAPFRWTGEAQRAASTGVGYDNIRRDQMTQAMRTLVNEVERDLGVAAYRGASRAIGTAGTTPFNGTLDNAADVLQVLLDNGAPNGDLSLVINTAAGANVRKITQLTRANEAGTAQLREQGILLPIFGMALRESAGVAAHVAGTGASYVTNGARAAGDTTIPVQTGTGTILAGDVLTFAGDANRYVTGTALAGGSLAINAPGLRGAVASGAAVTRGAGYAANVAFHRSAIVLVTRAPALPEEGDMADDRMTITDPRTGLSFEVSVYTQYRRVRYEVALAWGVANIKPAHTALLMG